jgi:GAF domain-containing protein
MPAMDDCAEMQNALLATRTVEDFVQELPRIAVRHVAEAASCGMTIRPDGHPITVAATDPVAARVDQVQYRLDDSPCLHAMRDGEVVIIDDIAGSMRWPEFEAQAAAVGIRSCLAVPVSAGPDGDAIGVLSLYAGKAGAFGNEQLRRAERFAETASGALKIAERLATYTGLNEQLRASLASRPVIDQALGIIIAREKCTQSAAFGILRTASQNSNTKLRDLAARIVTDVTGEPLQPPPFAMPGDGGDSGDPGDAGRRGDPSAAPTLG